MRQKIEQFEEIWKHIENINTVDAIVQTRRLNEILKIFTKNIVDEKTMSDLFDFLNAKALQDDGFILKFCSVMCSRQMETFNINGKIARYAMLEILQKNFQSSEHYKRDDMNKFYNSLRLLGEFYNRGRNANGFPISILGQSLLNLLNIELEKELKTITHFKNDTFSEILLTQMALNGYLLKKCHKTELDLMQMYIRKVLIEVDSLSSKTKAFLIMSLDLCYNSFNDSSLEKLIEKIYEPYLKDSDAQKTCVKEPKKVDGPTEKPLKGTTKQDRNLHHDLQPTTSQKQLDSRSSAPKNPAKPLRPSLGKQSQAQQSHQNHRRQSHEQPKSPQKKISPKELRTRTNSSSSHKTSPRNDTRSLFNPKALHKVESAIDKLQIKSSNETTTTTRQISTNPPELEVPQSTTIDESNTILKQQNSNGNGSIKPQAPANKVYFKEENVENLSWNVETSFEDPENPADPTSPNNQYSSSFLNFLSNN